MSGEDDRTCLITGGAQGIGRGIAKQLARDGANVVVNYRSSEAEAAELVETIEANGGRAMAIQADVSDKAAVEEMADRAREAFGPIDVLINNAGVTRDTKFTDMSKEEWDTVIDVNLTGSFNCTKVFYEDIRDAEEGRIINISSIVGKQGNLGQANYAAAKAGLFGLTRTLAIELAPSGSTANCVAPGFTRTAMLETVPESVLENILEKIPLNRFATVDDIASMVSYLASEDSSYITGEVIDVNGGMDL